MSVDPGAVPVPGWFAELRQRFGDLRSAEKLPHALLLGGVAGSGKGWLADALAAEALCSNPADGACGDCKSCHLIVAGSHADLRTVDLVEDAKRISVDQVRELNRFLLHTAQIGRRKVAIVRRADLLNRNAANALLKTLEEPPPDTLILLLADRPGGLLPTIRSRCRQWRIQLPPAAVASRWLIAAGVPERDADALLKLAEWRPFAALEWYRDESWRRRQDTQKLIGDALAGDLAPLIAAKQMAGFETQGILDLMMTRVHQQACASVADLDQLGHLERFYRHLQSLHREVTRGTNPNPMLLWESVLLGWQSLQWRLKSNARGS